MGDGVSWASIRTQLAARLALIAGIGQVHDRQRFSVGKPGSPQFDGVFLVGGRLNCWMVTRVRRRSAPVDGEAGRELTHSVLILGLYGFWDLASTGTVFDDLVDLVADDLRDGDRTLGGACVSVGEVDAQLSIGSLQGLAENFHLAQLRFDVVEVV